MSRQTSIALAITLALAVVGASPSVSAKSVEENRFEKQQTTPKEQVEDSTQPKCEPCGYGCC